MPWDLNSHVKKRLSSTWLELGGGRGGDPGSSLLSTCQQRPFFGLVVHGIRLSGGLNCIEDPRGAQILAV